MKLRRRNFKKAEEAQNFWPSFADVMSTVVLVFFFLILLAYIYNIITSNQLKNTSAELDAKQARLISLEEEYNANQQKLEESRQQISEAENQLNEAENQLRSTMQEIEKQKQIIAESNQELIDLRTKLQDIAVLRVNILNKVKESIEKEIGKTNDRGEPLVTVGPNANLVINESVVFDSGSYNIKSQGKELLKQFAIAFEKILDDDTIRENIDSINIEGHADIEGSSDFNRELSSQRAYTVVNYMMSSNPSLENKYGKYFAATGFSEFRPIDSGTTPDALQKNRRIEISISIKDSNIQNIIEDYLKDTDKLLNAD